MSSTDDLPPALPAMWRALKRGYEAAPLLLSVAFGLSLLAALPDALLALWFKLLADGVLGGRRGLVTTAALGLGVSAAATWFLRVISDRTQRRFRDQVTIALESHVAWLQASVATVEHHERPEYLDRLAMLRNQVFVLDHMYMSLFTTCGWILRLGVTVALLVSIHPALALLAAFALPTVLTSAWRPGVERAVEERGASANRLARHLFDVATTAPPGKEVRVTGIGARLVAQRRAAWERWYGPVAYARARSAVWHALAWAVFGAAYVGAIVFVASMLASPPGEVLLVLAAGARLSAYIGGTVGEIGFLRGIWLEGSKRLAWLEDYAASQAQGADAPVPERLGEGIRFEHVSFAYPGTDRLVLDDVELRLAPGAVVAIVGENGAGKTTLVKLLCRLYQPTKGRILVDGVELARVPPATWRSRLAGAFQDFFRFEWAWATCRAATTGPPWRPRSSAPARATSCGSSRPGSRRSSGPPGPRGWSSASDSGRSWSSRGDSCASARSCSCWTSPLRRSMPRRSMPCSSGMRQRPADPTTASRSSCPTASAPSAWRTSSWCCAALAWSSRARTRR